MCLISPDMKYFEYFVFLNEYNTQIRPLSGTLTRSTQPVLDWKEGKATPHHIGNMGNSDQFENGATPISLERGSNSLSLELGWEGATSFRPHIRSDQQGSLPLGLMVQLAPFLPPGMWDWLTHMIYNQNGFKDFVERKVF